MCQRLLFGLPAFRLAATPPCRFIAFLLGLGVIPFDVRHSSRRECRGPWVDMRLAFSVSTTIDSKKWLVVINMASKR